MADPRTQPWAVLGLDPSWFAELPGQSSFAPSSASASTDDATRSALIRRAYRRALLQHHPDKQAAAAGGGSSTSSTIYTVDQIKSAYTALGGGGPSASQKAVLGGLATGSTATGLEIVDLDELPFDEAEQADGVSVQTWYRSCRCGNARGFTFDEHDLEEELDAEAMETLAGDGSSDSKQSAPAVGELMVGCQDCSLWLCVHFAAAPDDEDDEDE